MRRTLRISGTVLVTLGVLGLAWSIVVWRWQDPFTALYTHWEQGKLAHQYDHRADRVEAAEAVDDVSGGKRAERDRRRRGCVPPRVASR